MTEPEHQPAALVENMLLLRREDFDELLDRAAERGAERCLAHLGLENGSAAKDIRELRDLLEAWRDARRTAWQTTIKVVTTGILAALLVGAAKYRPEFPARGFADLDGARAWAAAFVHWYNVDHRHSGIRYVSPAQRHAGEDRDILAARHALYTKARELHPARWSGKTRNWSPAGAVTLNPERDCIVRSHSADNVYQVLVA